MPQANRLDFSVKSQRPPFIHIVCTEKKKQEKVYSFISSWLFIKPEPEVAVLNRKSASLPMALTLTLQTLFFFCQITTAPINPHCFPGKKQTRRESLFMIY